MKILERERQEREKEQPSTAISDQKSDRSLDIKDEDTNDSLLDDDDSKVFI